MYAVLFQEPVGILVSARTIDHTFDIDTGIDEHTCRYIIAHLYLHSGSGLNPSFEMSNFGIDIAIPTVTMVSRKQQLWVDYAAPKIQQPLRPCISTNTLNLATLLKTLESRHVHCPWHKKTGVEFCHVNAPIENLDLDS